MKSLVKYLTYRDGRDGSVKQAAGKGRWMDRGMGSSAAEIAERCEAYQSQHVLMFSVILNPNPDLTALVPHDKREHFVRSLTERTVEDFFEARGIENGVEWSAVLHHRRTDDPQSPGLHDPHTHVVLPGTYYDEDAGERLPLYFSRNQKVDHIELLHGITEQHMATLMERYVGLEWEQRYDALEAARDRQKAVIAEPPHGELPEIGVVWSGARRTDEQSSAVGVYGFFHDDLDAPNARVLRFRSLLTELPHDQAEALASYLGDQLKRDAAAWEAQVERVKAMSTDERLVFCATLQNIPREPERQPYELDIEL